MGNLKTINIEGQAYFVTSRIVEGQRIFIFDKFCRIIIDNLNFYKRSKSFRLLGYVIMLDHLHLILWPQGKYTISDFMRNFKEFTAKEIIKALKDNREALTPRSGLVCPARAGLGACPSPADLLEVFSKTAESLKNQSYKVWQSRNWIENIYSQKFLAQKLNYVHTNPVKAGLVKDPVDWPYSSAKNYYLNDNSLIKIDLI